MKIERKQYGTLLTYGVMLFGLQLGVAGCDNNQGQTPTSTKNSPTASVAPPNSEEVINGVHYPELSTYFALMKEGRFRDARNYIIMRMSASSADLKHLIADAEIKDYLKVINDPKAPKDKKKEALLGLAYDYPSQARPFAEQIKQAEIATDKAKAAKEKSDEIKLAAERKRKGVSIGMTKEEVIASSWGRPQSINRTVTNNGVHEQWIYNGGYLYLDDGILTVIQN